MHTKMFSTKSPSLLLNCKIRILASAAATLLCPAGPVHSVSAASLSTDTTLSLTVQKVNQNVLVTWFGANGVPFQLESSSNLTSWTSLGPMMIGNGAPLTFIDSIAARSRAFYRVGRVVPANNTATFNPPTGLLTIVGDDQDNVIVLSRNAAGAILVNNGGVAMLIAGGTPTVANTLLIQIFGRSGNDQISLNEVNGALPVAQLFGEDGNDTLTGGSGNDLLDGGADSDTLLGKGGADSLYGGDGDDTLTGGDANDFVQGGIGNDRIIWNPGDDTDVNEGGAGVDTVEVNAGNGAETFAVTANGSRVRFDRPTPGPFSLDIGACEKLVLNGNGGADIITINDLSGTDLNDVRLGIGDGAADTVTINGTEEADSIMVNGSPGSVSVTGLSASVTIIGIDTIDLLTINALGGDDAVGASGLGAAVIGFTADGGAGADILVGGAGNDTLLGGPDDDVLIGGPGFDVLDGGSGSNVLFPD